MLENFKTYFTAPIIIPFVIGFVIGGLVIGFIDANRPTPLFSSADGGGSQPAVGCETFWALLTGKANQMDQLNPNDPNSGHEYDRIKNEEWLPLVGTLNPFDYQSYLGCVAARNEYHLAQVRATTAALRNFFDSHPEQYPDVNAHIYANGYKCSPMQGPDEGGVVLAACSPLYNNYLAAGRARKACLCTSSNPELPPLPPRPTPILSFDAEPGSIVSGDDSTLSWTIDTGDASPTITLETGNGSSNPAGNSLTVYPEESTTYTLIANNHGKESTKQVEITVTRCAERGAIKSSASSKYQAMSTKDSAISLTLDDYYCGDYDPDPPEECDPQHPVFPPCQFRNGKIY